MRYFFHIFDGSELHPDDVGNNLPSLEHARRLAEVVADELKKGGEFSRSSLVIVADENDNILLECGASKKSLRWFPLQDLRRLSRRAGLRMGTGSRRPAAAPGARSRAVAQNGAAELHLNPFFMYRSRNDCR